MIRKVSCKNPVCGSTCFSKSFDSDNNPVWNCANCFWVTKRIVRKKAGLNGLTKSQILAMRRITFKYKNPYRTRKETFTIKQISITRGESGIVYLSCRNGNFCDTYNLDRFHFAIGPKGGLKDLNK